MDENVVVTVSNDKLSAYIRFLPPDEDGKKLSFEEVLHVIGSARVTYGVEESVIKYIFNTRIYDRDYKIADGYPPKDGVDGRIEYKYDFESDTKLKVDERGNVDYLNVENYQSVKEGDVLAEYIPPTKGISGINVFGGVISAKNGKGLRLPIGKNVKLLDDETTIVAEIDGLLEFIAGKLVVSPVLYINSDVDVATGNIDFIGSIQINGSVKTGMTVVAGGSITVRGPVEGATIRAAGSIVMSGGLKGMGKAFIKAGEEVFARYIENATVIAGSAIKSSFVLKSELQSHDYVEIIGSRSGIIGGSVKAKNFIKTKNTGSTNYVITNLEVGFLPEFRQQVIDLEKEIKKIKEELVNLSKVSRIPDAGLNEQQLAIKARLLKEHDEKNVRLAELEEEYVKVTDSMQANEKSYIMIEDTANIGTVITVNTSRMVVKTPFKFSTFRELDGEIEVLPADKIS